MAAATDSRKLFDEAAALRGPCRRKEEHVKRCRCADAGLIEHRAWNLLLEEVETRGSASA